MFSFFKKATNKVVTEQNCIVGQRFTDSMGNDVICVGITTNSMGKRLVATRPYGIGSMGFIESSLTPDEYNSNSMWRD